MRRFHVKPERRDATHDASDLQHIKDIKDWLFSGLVGFHLENKNRWAFRPYELEIGRDQTVELDLARLYGDLSVPLQSKWRIAVAELLAEVPESEESIEIATSLLEMTRLLTVHESLSVLSPKFGSNIFGKFTTVAGTTLFELALECAAELAYPTKSARRCLEDLVSSGNYNSTYAGIAFISLCRVDPENWFDHLARLGNSLHVMFCSMSDSQEAKRRYSDLFLQAVGLDRLFENFDKLKISTVVGSKSSSDAWIVQSIFTGRRPLAVINRDEHRTKFFAWEVRLPDIQVEVKHQVGSLLGSEHVRNVYQRRQVISNGDVGTHDKLFLDVAVQLNTRFNCRIEEALS